MTTPCRVRAAHAGDCEEIMRMIQELAQYEERLNEMENSVEALRQDGFEEAPFFSCMVAELLEGEGTGPTLVGYSIFFRKYSSYTGRALFMDDLFVRRHYRGKGIGSQLLASVAQECLLLGCPELQFHVLVRNTPAIKFYFSRGAKGLYTNERFHLLRFQTNDLQRMVLSLEEPGSLQFGV
ncbi:thialysine N-epsilon-acetyltransferase [Xenopus laevis]|uniref:Thialysine N-epsilon-acetyltransferase n=1 Tax=Xenopus laevis TaxID=8355 RepID=A0A8J1MSY0_XENLA|nr:thialysine N-epsilon-acetyltransferase [Xenopus laevis]